MVLSLKIPLQSPVDTVCYLSDAKFTGLCHVWTLPVTLDSDFQFLKCVHDVIAIGFGKAPCSRVIGFIRYLQRADSSKQSQFGTGKFVPYCDRKEAAIVFEL